MAKTIMLAATLTVAACGLQPLDAPGDADPGGDARSQLEILNAALARVDVLVSRGPDFDYAAIRAAVLDDPRVAIVGTSPDGALWISTGDGPLAIIAIDPTPTSDPAAAVAREADPTRVTAVAQPVVAATGGIELPARATFRAYNALGAGFTDPTPDLSRMLTSKGYTSAATGAPTVEELRGVKDVGVLFIKTHGEVLSTAVGPTGTPLPYYALYTTTPYPDADEEKILNTNNDWFKRRIAIFDAVKQKGWFVGSIPERHYAITEGFVSSYMTVADHGVVLIEACNSGTNPGAAFGQAFKAALYVGWDGYANAKTADDTERYLVDRLLGANDSAAPPEDPKQRAFGLTSLGIDLKRKHLAATTSDLGTANLSYLGNAILAPSIRNIDVDETAKTLTFHGSFGSKADSVSFGTQNLAVQSWGNDTIVTNLPDAGGDATVIVDGRESNVVQLTDWNGGTFTYTLTANTTGGVLTQEVTWKPHFRADLHAYRNEPGVAPPDRAPVQLTNAADSTCHYKSSGTDVQTSSTVEWSGEGDLAPMTGSSTGSGCVITVTIDPRAGATAAPAMAFARAIGGFTIKVTPGTTVHTDTIPDPAVYSNPNNWGLAITRDDGFNLTPGSGTPTPVVIHSGSVTGLGTLSWDAQPASSRPDPAAAR